MAKRGVWAAAAVVVGCLAEEPDGPAGPVLTEDEAALHDLLAMRSYREWPRPPEDAERRAARGPHGAFVEIYLDTLLAESLDHPEGLEVWPDGVTAICEGYDSEDAAEPAVVSVAGKRDGAWRWLQVDAEHDVVVSGTAGVCVGCHGGGQDFMFSVTLPLPAE